MKFISLSFNYPEVTKDMNSSYLTTYTSPVFEFFLMYIGSPVIESFFKNLTF